MVYNTDSAEYNYYSSTLGQWAGFNGIPNQSGNAGNFLTTDGTNVSWIGLPTGTLIGSTNSFATETWLGVGAGDGGASSVETVFIGTNTGSGATNAFGSTFVGFGAGYLASEAGSATFIGQTAGEEATNATGSVFIGASAGSTATNASGSIFIGSGAGSTDTVDNFSTGGTSILIGDGTSTGGFSNSIALGSRAFNTASNQFVLGSAANAGFSDINEIFLGMNATNSYPILYGNLGGVAVGASSVDASALLDLTSTAKGFLAPRMTELERDAIASPATGLFVYNTDTNAFNYYDGSAWGAIGGGSSLSLYREDTAGITIPSATSGGIAIGSNASASNFDAIAIGTKSISNASASMAFGYNTTASGS
jgi:hypothetical protein